MGYIDFLTCIHSKFFTLRLPTKSFVFHFSDFSLKSLRESFQRISFQSHLLEVTFDLKAGLNISENYNIFRDLLLGPVVEIVKIEY